MKNVIQLPDLKSNHREVDGMYNRDTSYDYDESSIDYSGEQSNQDDLDMAAKLFWRPIADNTDPIDKRLKWILSEEDMINKPLTLKDISFLKGIRAAAPDLENDTTRLIDAIEKFGYIELYLVD